MQVKKLSNITTYQEASYFTNLLSKAVKAAKVRNHENGLPNDFVVNNKRFYELPDGEITTENPLTNEDSLTFLKKNQILKPKRNG